MRMVFAYLWKVICHKWFVFIAGRACGVSYYRLLIHDWSKFTPLEFMGYARKFHGKYMTEAENGKAMQIGCAGSWWPQEKVDKAFSKAWLHHQHANPHHWQYWCPVEAREGWDESDPLPFDGLTIAVKMPEKFAREMVADWWAAGRAYDGAWRLPEWYEDNKRTMVLHPETREFVERLIVKSASILKPPEPEGAGTMLGDG